MFRHAQKIRMYKKMFYCIFIILVIHAYFVTVLACMSELDNLVNHKRKLRPILGNGYRRQIFIKRNDEN